MSQQAQKEGQASQSEDDETDAKLQSLDIKNFFSKENHLLSAMKYLESKNKYYKETYTTIKEKIENEWNQDLQESYYQVSNEVDWTQFEPVFAYNTALDLSRQGETCYMRLFEMVNESFWNQVCAYFKFKFDYQNDDDPKNKVLKQSRKFRIDDRLFKMMTL